MTKELIHELISFIDLTTLSDTDNESSVLELVTKANAGIDGTRPAAICVFPNFGEFVKNNTSLHVAVVGGCFPSGQTTTEAKIQELKEIAKTNVDEVDIVINRGQLKAGELNYVAKEIKQAKTAIGPKHLKVILETGQLTKDEIGIASKIAIDNGADFIKTSTGKSEIGATEEAAQIMCDAIKQSGKNIGFKPSGGIRTYEDAFKYYSIVQNTLGNEWLTPELFRIGASSLFDKLAKELKTL